MRSFAPNLSAKILTTLALLLAAAGCQTQTTTNTANAVNSGANTANMSNTSNANMTTTTTTSPTGATIQTTEPQQYSATITMKVEVTGDKSMSVPALSADFARNGSDRRISFKLPGGEQVVYLDRSDKRFILLPNRKQYAEIDAQSTGFNVPQVMTPAQIIGQVKNASGCEQAGEEQFGGRSAIKYRCSAAAKTGTQAGDVKSESFIYVDKDTSLPLHSESVISSSGSVGGASAVKVVTELSNIQTTVPADTFSEPTNMSKVDPNQVRSQVEAILKAAAYFAQGMMQGAGTSAAPTATPAVTPAVNTTPTH